ncbi:MAG: rhodanese-like domain-containing protein [Chlamydiales bacterium]|nr:rhodanese-like domain-containing protein [Chlamydiales bacterium]
MNTNIHTIEPNTLKGWLDAKKALLIDVREASEYNAEHIPGSIHLPLSTFNPNDIVNKENKMIIFQCRLGRRSLDAATKFSSSTNQETYSLLGGIVAWKESGFSTTSSQDTL